MSKIVIGGLWKQLDSQGRVYLSGKLGKNLRILVFANNKKTADSKEPDYELFLAETDDDVKHKTQDFNKGDL